MSKEEEIRHPKRRSMDWTQKKGTDIANRIQEISPEERKKMVYPDMVPVQWLEISPPQKSLERRIVPNQL